MRADAALHQKKQDRSSVMMISTSIALCLSIFLYLEYKTYSAQVFVCGACLCRVEAVALMPVE